MSDTTSELIAQQILNGNVNKRTWSDILYNVKVYGAAGDGIKDDTSAIQSAMDAATVNGGVVFFPPGNYNVTTSFTIPFNVKVEGIEFASILTATSVMDSVFNLQSGTIESLRINGNLKASKGVSLSGNYCNVQKCYIEYCTYAIYNVANDAHNLLYNSTANNTYSIYSADRFINIIIDGHQSRGNDGYGIYCTYTTQQPQGIRITNGLFFGNTQGGIKFAKDAYEIEIVNNMIDGSYGIAIDIAGSPSAVSQCYKIQNNFIAAANSVSGGVGIWVRPGARDIVITANTITLSSYFGVLIEATAATRCSSISIRDNKFNGNDRQGSSGDIFADSVEDLVMDANRLLTTTGTSLTFSASFAPGNANVTNNVFKRPVSVGSGTNIFHDNKGYLTENRGVATVLSGQTSVVVTHGLSSTPTRVLVTPYGNLGLTWADTFTSTTFTFRCSSAPGANVNAGWSASF